MGLGAYKGLGLESSRAHEFGILGLRVYFWEESHSRSGWL